MAILGTKPAGYAALNIPRLLLGLIVVGTMLIASSFVGLFWWNQQLGIEQVQSTRFR